MAWWAPNMSSVYIPFVPEKAEAIIVVPPFAGIDRPCLAVHLLQACAKDRGINVGVVYANLMLAREIGESVYSSLCWVDQTVKVRWRRGSQNFTRPSISYFRGRARSPFPSFLRTIGAMELFRPPGS